MRFEIRYPNGQTHEVELQGTIAILGRDPSCDLVINDVKCSRRHAVMEAGPDGLVVRDSGSANGVFVNGRKIDRQALKERDEVKLGDVTLVVLPDEIAGTVVMAPDEYGQIPVGPATAEMPAIDPDGTIMPGPNAIPPVAPPLPAAVPPPGPGTAPMIPAAPTPPRPAAPPSVPTPAAGAPPLPSGGAPPLGVPPPRPVPPPPGPAAAPTPPAAVPGTPTLRSLTLTALAILWGLNVPLWMISCGASAFAGEGIGRIVGVLLAVAMIGVSGLMGWGMWTLKPWARMAQVVIAGLGILTCSFAVASIATILYLLRPAAKARFAGEPAIDPRETLFAALVIGGVVLGAIAGVGIWGALAFFGNAARTIPSPS